MATERNGKANYLLGVLGLALITAAGWAAQDVRSNAATAVSKGAENETQIKLILAEDKHRDEALQRIERKINRMLVKQGLSAEE